jgi:hypothetical protein
MLWATMALLLATVAVGEGKNITTTLNLSQHWDNNWEGSFCFTLDTSIVGYEIVMHFSTPVQHIQVC